MSTLLPVLRENHPAMSLCVWCPQPGHCCKGFSLNAFGDGKTYGSNFSYWKQDRDGILARKCAEAELLRRGLPFTISGVAEEWRTVKGYAFLRFKFDCPKLQADGRCGIYLNRPSVCRDFIPGTDDLCIVKRTA